MAKRGILTFGPPMFIVNAGSKLTCILHKLWLQGLLGLHQPTNQPTITVSAWPQAANYTYVYELLLLPFSFHRQ